MAGLFDTFTIAVRGLAVQQSLINTTSHNIANAATTGYSRQRSVAETTKPFGASSKFETNKAGQVGTGAEITSIQRIRDSFIDYQLRSESGASEYYNATSTTLSAVTSTFGEPSDTGIQELMSKFYASFSGASKPTPTESEKSAAISSASALADAINYTYNALQNTIKGTQIELQNSVLEVNSYLDQINELNKQISEVSSVNQTPNDLMDKRDNLLDSLSKKFGIKIDPQKFNAINLSSTEYPNAALVKSDPNDVDYNRFSYVESATADTASGNLTGSVTVKYYPFGNKSLGLKSFSVVVNNTADADGDGTPNTAADAKVIKKDTQKYIDNLMQNRILLADENGNVVKVTTTAVSPAPTVPSPMPTDGTVYDTSVTPPTTTVTKTKTTASGFVTTITTTPITTEIPSTKTITTITNDTTGTTATGETITKSEPTTKSELDPNIFKTYEYENGINNVDTNKNNIKGDIASEQEVQKTIKGYMDNLDRLAAGLAYSVNAIQTGSIDDSKASQGLGNDLIFVTYDEKNKVDTDKDKGITASTIRINSVLVKHPGELNCHTTLKDGAGDGKRAAAISNLNVAKMTLSNVASGEDLTEMNRADFLKKVGIDTTTTPSGFSDTDCLKLNTGIAGTTATTYYTTIISNVSTDTQEAARKGEIRKTNLASFEDSKSQVSGVSLDEEYANLIQFQHAYQANAKIISTIDELLDVVINGLKK
ncbi:hypothetical protein psyc5s11_47030 [Clostridium gelidum]|uniref:Flagellar hook-associated protein 1 n=1 Tax=Clostridium gelidum TaxID=704125 RepID=A0ABN6J2R2_9CLOT|nr:flagellar hook-associated protein FlgK [Clostridium gelidum]BCZ48636.1 hypothetical protein psyc5s11_47030 [Clostridium gelidum]